MEDVDADYVRDIRNLILDEGNFPMAKISELANDFRDAFQSGHKVAFVGNGGSAAEAMHIAAEFTGKCVIDHSPWPVMCLNESQSSITAIGNDYGFDHIFERQVLAHLRKGDILICLSTSGKSPNIRLAIAAAQSIGCQIYLWTGAGHESEDVNYQVWKVNSLQTPRIQEIHLMWGHILSQIVEKIVEE